MKITAEIKKGKYYAKPDWKQNAKNPLMEISAKEYFRLISNPVEPLDCVTSDREIAENALRNWTEKDGEQQILIENLRNLEKQWKSDCAIFGLGGTK